MDSQTALTGRDHGGGLDAAITKFGGSKEDWIDLSTGINPNPYPFTAPPLSSWSTLPDKAAMDRAERAARAFWKIPDDADVVLVPGLSIAIAQLPYILDGSEFSIAEPTYNEYTAAFLQAGWTKAKQAKIRIFVSPNNPTGDWTNSSDLQAHSFKIIDESFADVDPDRSLISHASQSGCLVLKGLGKFWGLAGVRFGLVCGDPELAQRLRSRLGPWAVSGPALQIAAEAHSDLEWAQATRKRLHQSADALDQLMSEICGSVGTPLFRLYNTQRAKNLFLHLAEQQVLTRVFPYDENLIRLGIPKDQAALTRIANALSSFDSAP